MATIHLVRNAMAFFDFWARVSRRLSAVGVGLDVEAGIYIAPGKRTSRDDAAGQDQHERKQRDEELAHQ
jgi:hypothetical protein